MLRPHHLLLIAAATAATASTNDTVLLDDAYRSLKPGMLSSGVIGAHAEYHYLKETAPQGHWVVSTFLTPGSQRAWRVIEENGQRLIWQSWTASERERAGAHPLLVAGHELWTDYTVRLRFIPAAAGARSGIVFRYRTDRACYFAGVQGGQAILSKIDGGAGFRLLNETVLAAKPLARKEGDFVRIKVTAAADRLSAEFGGGVKLEARDTAFPRGRIGFTADGPAKFGRVRVTCSAGARAAFDKARRQAKAEEARLQAANPAMVLWRKIPTPGFGVGRNLRFGDLDGDGRLDILVAQQTAHGPTDRYSEAGCLTALTLDGRQLWQNGLPDPWHDQLTSDVAVQIHDVDGDGRKEVIYCRDMEIVVAEGATGKLKYKAPTPEAPPVPGQTNRFPRILGDSLFFCDLRGQGADRDLVLKDRYWNVWAYTGNLDPLWHLALNTGHYPFAFDVDRDGKDELAIGYSLVSHDGRILWSLDRQLQDHADGVAIVSLKDGAEPRFLCAASDEGFVLADLKGHVLEHLQLGHVQNPSVANYRPDLPGLEAVTINFWGNQGIVNMFDADGRWYGDLEPAQHGSMMLPLNWRGDGQEFWILSSNEVEGGAYDGWGRRVLRFPADGHPDLCVAALDVTGDCRDELVVWDAWEIWIYTQSDNPKRGRLYMPERNALYNESNYRATVSIPGWSE